MITPIEAVYYVESLNPDRRYHPLVIRPKIHKEKKRCEWSNGEYIDFEEFVSDMNLEEIKKKPPHKFTLIDSTGDQITFVLMTVKLFNEKMSEEFPDSPIFSSDEELQKYYLYTNF